MDNFMSGFFAGVVVLLVVTSIASVILGALLHWLLF